jgi:archaellum component FlaF (FlaF/FlaG flagellin family)
MKTQIILSSLLSASIFLFSQCDKLDELGDGHGVKPSTEKFKVTIENVQIPKLYFSSGVFNTPKGAGSPGPATPGNAFEFSFNAGKGQRLSFVTMFGRSNDLFFAPDGKGIELYQGDTPISGDITSMIKLWDAGTEMNEAPGMGMYQANTEPAPNTGPGESKPVTEISMVNDGFTYPSVASILKVTISNDGTTKFTVRIEDVMGAFTPVSPGCWVIHTSDYPIFEPGKTDRGLGLEANAEDGNPVNLGKYLSDNSGLVTPISPGVWTVTKAGMHPVFQNNQLDYGDGLKFIAQGGDPTMLASALKTKSGILSTGVYNIPLGASAAAPLLPGDKFEFTVTATKGSYLSFASMFGQSNDLFFAPSDTGIPLWNGNVPTFGDVSSQVSLWDDGTEVNEYPGAGNHQPARGTGGVVENKNIMVVNDGYTYMATSSLIKVTITPL